MNIFFLVEWEKQFMGYYNPYIFSLTNNFNEWNRKNILENNHETFCRKRFSHYDSGKNGQKGSFKSRKYVSFLMNYKYI